MLQKSTRLLLAAIITLSVISCQSHDPTSIASRYPRFARDTIHLLEKYRSSRESSREVTLFEGATPRGTPFVAIGHPGSSFNGMTGSHVRGSGLGRDSFTASPMLELFITTQDYTVDLAPILRFPSLISYRVIVADDSLITIDLELLKVVFQRQQGTWKAIAVQCQFPRQEVSLEKIHAETHALYAEGTGDITYPPGHTEREGRYRIMLLNYVAAKHAQFKHSEVYTPLETTHTFFLTEWLYGLIEKGVPVTFAP